MYVCFFVLGIIAILIGFIQLFSPQRPGGLQTPTLQFPSIPSLRNQQPAAQSQTSPVAGAVSPAAGGNMNATVSSLSAYKPGDRLQVVHPSKGTLQLHVISRVRYTELWQTQGTQGPWVPTGNTFIGLWLETDVFLLNWQLRYYLLDEKTPVTDNDIQRDFLPYARQFAQSNQTANILFSYPPAMWHIDDIGKFRIEGVDGSTLAVQPGAVGRFIHASGDSARALVLEDYEGGSGQDMVWTGVTLNETDIQKL
jgi:hypothetical protein